MNLSKLEQRYRLLLSAYPKAYRADREDEIIATLLDGATPGQTMPSPAAMIDLLGHAAQRRFSVLSTAEFSSAARLAAPWALAIAAGISAFVWWRVEPRIPTTGPLAYAAWLAALGGWVLVRSRMLIGVAIVATLLTMPLAAIGAPERPPLWIIMSLTGLGCIAFAGCRRDQSMESGLNVVAAAAAIAVSCGMFSPSPRGYYQPIIASIGAVVAAGVLATAAVAIQRRRRGQSARLPIIAGLLIALPATWLGPIDTIAWHLPMDNLTAARFGRLAHVVLATCVVLCAIAWFGRGRAPLQAGRLSGMMAGSAIGYGVFMALNRSASHAVVTVAVLSLIAILLRAWPSRSVMSLSAVAMLGVCWLVGFYANNWLANGWADPARTVVLASMLSIVPCSVIAFAAFRPGARVVAGLAAGGWICYLSLPALVAWGPLLWALAATIAAMTIHRLTRRLSETIGSRIAPRT